MKTKKSHITEFPDLGGFKLSVTYSDLTSEEDKNKFFHHRHSECEIYINLSGNVSFIVEDNTYEITPGSVIITKPYENHHCVYHSIEGHKHFWILFDPGGNKDIFDFILDRPDGESNMILLTPEKFEEVTEVCERLLDTDDTVSSFMYFFRLISTLRSGRIKSHTNEKLTEDIACAIDYIVKNLDKPLRIAEIANMMCVSLTGFERNFKRQLGVTPREYIMRKKLYFAKKALDDGASVQQVCDMTGFCDSSHFIRCFKKQFGVTPHKYKSAYTLKPLG